MTKFCPSCGTKVDEGNKFCLKCGAQLNPESTADATSSNENISQQPNQQVPPTQPKDIPTGQKKSNKNFLIALIAIIAIVIVIVVIIIFTGGGIDNRFVGEWEISSDGFDFFYWTFSSDGSLIMEVSGFDIEIATWSVSGNQICLDMRENEFWVPEGYADEICYDYEFSDGGNTVSLSIEGSENLVLTKI